MSFFMTIGESPMLIAIGKSFNKTSFTYDTASPGFTLNASVI